MAATTRRAALLGLVGAATLASLPAQAASPDAWEAFIASEGGWIREAALACQAARDAGYSPDQVAAVSKSLEGPASILLHMRDGAVFFDAVAV